MANAGDVVAGHKLLEKVGEGHYGEVWKAEFMGHPVALKLFRPRRKAASARREALAQYALGRLEGEDRRFFPRVEHVAVEEEPAYLRMEFIEGRPLEDRLFPASPAPVKERLELGRKILEALAAVHRHGFVHGDLSPLNILVTRDGAVKLIDVGTGALFDDGGVDLKISTTAEEASDALGVASPLYAAPERFSSEFLKGCGKPADVFSFGKVLYGLVMGEHPFVIKPFSMKHHAMGTLWDDFLFQCLEEKPESRFPDAGAALERYQALIGSPSPVSGLPSPDIEFVDEDVLVIEDDPPPNSRARKFCPRCGRSILLEAKKCRHCKAWVDELAKKIVDQRRNPPKDSR